MIDLLLLVAGLVILLLGASVLVEGASQLARTLGASELVIGLTVVAFGTSAPELSVNGLAALAGDTTIAFGNVIGSNLANTGLIIGAAALLAPLAIRSQIIYRELPMMLLATATALVLALDRLSGGVERYDRQDGLALLLLFAVFLYYTAVEVVAQRRADPLSVQARQTARGWGVRSTLMAVTMVIVGLASLIGGGQLSVSRAISVAEGFGVPAGVIGLTVIAIGTSLPELATSLVATWKGQTDLAVGNVVGSNIFNLLFILGTTAVLRPVEVPARGATDLLALAAFSVALLLMCASHRATVRRWEGAILLATYVVYIAWRAG